MKNATNIDEQLALFDKKIDKTITSVEKYGVRSSMSLIQELYDFTIENIRLLPKLKQIQKAGLLFSYLSYNTKGSKMSNLAYYCLSKSTTSVPLFLPPHLILSYVTLSRSERTKLLLCGGIQLISNRIYMINDLPHQDALDLSILGDIIILKEDGFDSSEDWWKRALEDEVNIRHMYKHYTSEEIIKISEKVHNVVSNKVFEELVDIL